MTWGCASRIKLCFSFGSTFSLSGLKYIYLLSHTYLYKGYMCVIVMGKTQYQKCIELLKSVGDEITLEELIRLIKIRIGNDKYRVIIPCLNLMKETKLIKEENGLITNLSRS